MDYDEDPDYLDLDDIQAHAQLVNCKFLLYIPELKFLSPGKSQNVKPGSELFLPFWMAKTMYAYSMIDIDLPKGYNQNSRDTLKADPLEVNLHRLGPNYYEFGILLLGLRREKGNNLAMFTAEGQRNKYRREEDETLEERRLIAMSLIDTFHRRRHKLIEVSINALASNDFQQVKELESRLDNLEKRLYRLGKKQKDEIKLWRDGKIELISNDVISRKSSKKRRLNT